MQLRGICSFYIYNRLIMNFFFPEKQTHTHKEEGNEFQHKNTPQLHSKDIVEFIIIHKCERKKFYYIS